MITAALYVLKRGQEAVNRWESMSPEDREATISSANAVGEGVARLGSALKDRATSAVGAIQVSHWEKQRDDALDPPAEFRLARRVVELLEERPGTSLSSAAIARAVELDPEEEPALFMSLRLAAVDGYLREDGNDSWTTTAFADGKLSGGKRARVVEQQIIRYLEVTGIADRDELASVVGIGDVSAPEFLAGLERARSGGKVEWLGWQRYGLPPEDLKDVRPPAGLVARAEGPSGDDLQDAALDVGKAIQDLTDQVRRNPDAAAPAAPALDPYEALERLGKLHQTGVLTDAEYENKKSKLLAQI